jgi:Flp pilus assembly protein TadB
MISLVLMFADTLALAAAVMGGLAVLLLATRVVPILLARRAAASRLDAFVVGSAAWPARPATLGADQAMRMVRFPRQVRLPLPGWLAGRLRAVCVVLGAPVGAYLLWADSALAAAAALEAVLLVSLWGQSLVAVRASQLDAQTLPTLLRLSAVLRSGGSLVQAMEMVAEKGPHPTREEFARTLKEVAVGAALDDALERLAQRVGTGEYTLLALVLKVQRRLGGNLPQVLDNVAETVRQRVMLRKELGTLTAQQRLSTWILVLLPVGIGGLFFVIDRSFMAPLFTTDIGRLLVLLAAALQLMGGWALRWAGRIVV